MIRPLCAGVCARRFIDCIGLNTSTTATEGRDICNEQNTHDTHQQQDYSNERKNNPSPYPHLRRLYIHKHIVAKVVKK